MASKARMSDHGLGLALLEKLVVLLPGVADLFDEREDGWCRGLVEGPCQKLQFIDRLIKVYQGNLPRGGSP